MAVTFTRNSSGTYTASTGTWSGASTSSVTGSAIQVRGKELRYRELGLSLAHNHTLLFTPSAYPLRANTDEFVMPGDTVSWTGNTYVVKDVDPVAPDGYVIVARIIVGQG
jgi:hypothetical protein